MTTPRLLGAVLAGGEGRRMGGPKAGARVGGIPLVQRAVAALEPVCAGVVVVSARPVPEASVEVIPDRVLGAGPLAGLEAALAAAADRGMDGVLLLACDLPLVDVGLAARVAGSLGRNAAVAPARGQGGVEPLCAAYAVDVLPEVTRRLAGEDRSLHALFASVGGRVLTARELEIADDRPFLNVNRPGDVDRAEAILAERSVT